MEGLCWPVEVTVLQLLDQVIYSRCGNCTRYFATLRGKIGSFDCDSLEPMLLCFPMG